MMNKPASVTASILIRVLMLLLSAALGSTAEDNATITGTGVSLRAEPASIGKVLDTLPNRTRVEVLFTAGFAETVDGHVGSWCAVASGGRTGFVFGRYVTLDVGALPVIEGPAYDSQRDRIFYFAQTIRRLVGENASGVHQRLGEPDSL